MLYKIHVHVSQCGNADQRVPFQEKKKLK